jgi:hypothetical protein
MAGVHRNLFAAGALRLPLPRLADWRGAPAEAELRCRPCGIVGNFSAAGSPCPAATLLQANLDKHCEEGDEGTCMVHVT